MEREDIEARTRNWSEAFCAPMPAGLPQLLELASPEIRFYDPFNDVRGKEGLAAIIEDMVEKCVDPTFSVLDIAASEKAGYIRWRFDFRPKKSPNEPWSFSGMSEIHVAADGLITGHFDHWDSASQLFAKLPLIGWPIRKIQSSLSVIPPQR